MIRLFVGRDDRETLAHAVFCHSVTSRSSAPVSFTPIYRPTLKGSLSRPKGDLDSTDFSISRFLVPYLCDYRGWALWADGDMICTTDIAELWAQRNDRYAIMVKQQVHDAAGEGFKFGRLNEIQSPYQRKNWSSLILFNNAKCHGLTLPVVNDASGLYLHRFEWLPDSLIGAIEGTWNHLVGVAPYVPEYPKLIHFTRNPPWFRLESDPVGDYDDLWWAEARDVIRGEYLVPYLNRRNCPFACHESTSPSSSDQRVPEISVTLV